MSEGDLESFVEGRIKKATETFAEQLETEKKRGDLAEAALKTLTGERRHERFTALVSGKGGEGDGAPWAGGIDKHVPVLEKFAETFGEDSEEFKAYVELQSETAKTIAQSEAFREIGSSASGSVKEPVRRLEAMAKEYQKDHPTLTYEQAFAEVSQTPEGAQAYAESL